MPRSSMEPHKLPVRYLCNTSRLSVPYICAGYADRILHTMTLTEYGANFTETSSKRSLP